MSSKSRTLLLAFALIGLSADRRAAYGFTSTLAESLRRAGLGSRAPPFSA